MSEQVQADDITAPRVQMAFACEGISQDTMQRYTFNSVLDDLAAATFPVQTLQFFAVFGLEANVPQMFSRVRVLVDGPNNQRVAEQPLADLAFTPQRYRSRMLCGFPGITWPVPGRYTLRLLAGDRVLASFTVTLHQVVPVQSGGGVHQ